MVGIRLKSTALDAIVITTAVSLLGLGNGKNYAWRIVQSATTTGGSWVSAGVDSSVEYNLTGTSVTGGRILAQGYVNSSNQGSPSINILKEAIFASQLERNTFTGARFELVIEMAIDAVGGTLGAYVGGSMGLAISPATEILVSNLIDSYYEEVKAEKKFCGSVFLGSEEYVGRKKRFSSFQELHFGYMPNYLNYAIKGLFGALKGNGDIDPSKYSWWAFQIGFRIHIGR